MICENRWRKGGVARACDSKAIARYRVMADTQHPLPPMHQRTGLGKHFVEINLCRACAHVISAGRVGEAA